MPNGARGTIWWDFDGTLVSRPHMWTEVAIRLLDRHAPGHAISSGAIAGALETGLPWQRADHAHPELTSSGLWWHEVYRRYRAIFVEFGCGDRVAPDTFAAMREDILDASRYRVFDDVVPALTRAGESGWRNVMVSNHVPELPQLVAGLGLSPFFDAIVTSGVVGYEKPHRRLFDAALPHTQPDLPVWMIGDNVDADCRPVCALGMNAILVRGSVLPPFQHEATDLVAALDLIMRATTAQ
jgi:putative hydrolase of the HAD superfamily